jgi:hypothetical protein
MHEHEMGMGRPTRASDECIRFRLATASSVAQDTPEALRDVARQLRAQTDPPDFVTLHYGSERSAEEVWKNARALFGTRALHGGSSCRGIMSDRTDPEAGEAAMGAFAIWDAEGDYGTASEKIASEPRAAAARATRTALRRAGRAGEAPDLVWLTSAPGHEEAVLEGIKDVIGSPALIVGGSAADNEVAGTWTQISQDGASRDAVVVSVLFPSAPVACSFESGYAPTGRQGTVTKAQGRILAEIDGKPAADVYAEWTGLAAKPESGSVSILSEASMFPLGRVSSVVDGIPFHILAHPAVAHSDGRIELFSDIREGDEIWLMSGSSDSLVMRAGRIAAASHAQLPGDAVAGALVVYCGGCMLSVRDRLGEVARGVSEALDHAPFLGVFSFGEQGEVVCGDSEHGNLMISCIAFGRPGTPGRNRGERGEE